MGYRLPPDCGASARTGPVGAGCRPLDLSPLQSHPLAAQPRACCALDCAGRAAAWPKGATSFARSRKLAQLRASRTLGLLE